jgi:hypothetical protein
MFINGAYKMPISMDSLLEWSSKGDMLATEAISVIMEESEQGKEAFPLFSFSGEQYTIVVR